MSADDNLIATGLILIAAVFAVYYGLRRLLTTQSQAELRLPNGNAYQYIMGDYIRSYGRRGAFHGIDIILPKTMPHLYLDSLKGGGRHVQFVIDPAQAIRLEGNFNKSYRVFVPKRYEAVALSILTPDVMVTLQDYAPLFDVEIYGNHLRIIGNRLITRNQSLQDRIMYVALHVLQEVDHRLSSWTPSDERAATEQDLRLYNAAGVRIGGRYVTYSFVLLSVYWLVASFGVGLGGVYALATPEMPRRLGVGLLVVFGILLAGLLIITHRQLRSSRFRSFRG